MRPASVALSISIFCLIAASCGSTRPQISPIAAPTAKDGASASLTAEGDASVSSEDLDAAPPSSSPPTELAAEFVPRDLSHVLITGQSLAVGVAGAPPLTLTQPFGNLMFNTGVMAGNENLDSFEPLIEGDNIPGSKAVVETMTSSFANLVTELSGAPRHDLLMSVHASGAKPYVFLKKGTKPYTNGMTQVAAALEIAKKKNKSYVVRAVLNVHGESDHAEKTANYDHYLREWQADYERDIKALTNQRESVPMFHTQMSSWTRMMKGTDTSAIPVAQLVASIASKGKIVMVGPKYHLTYAKDGVHLTAHSYRHMGEDYAKAYRRVVLEGRPWEPLRPLRVTRDGAVITIKFIVPVPPLAIDTAIVTDPGNLGFEYSDSAAKSPTIKKVDVTGPDTVAITLSEAPTAEDRHIRYAFTGNRGLPSGPITGARGNLRDSDTTRSRSGYKLYNWCVHFDELVP
jgi:hypothetical protein